MWEKSTAEFPAPPDFSRSSCEGTSTSAKRSHPKAYISPGGVEMLQTSARSNLIFLQHIEERVAVIRNR